MTRNTPQELFDKNLITEEQFKRIEIITSGRILSVFYELRILLYLGVMMFTSGAGVLIYQNIGELGHIISIVFLTLIMIACFWYVVMRGQDYDNGIVKPPSAYFDYLLLLGCLLFVSIQGYIQYQYGTFTDLIEWNTLITSLFYFYVAYRYDHLGVLSLAITAFASFWGLSVSPQKWNSSEFLDKSDLHITAIVFGSALAAIVFYLDKKSIKKHFTFTYLNFCFLIYFIGALAGIFIDSSRDLIFVLLIYAGCAFAWYQAMQKKSYLFLLYAFLAGYIATTYLLAEYLFNNEPVIWYYYFLLSCGGVIWLIIRYKRLFKR
jgi:Predicted membrane protein (DUF2157)